MAPPPCHPGVARGGLLTVEHRTTRAKGPSPRPPISMLSLKLTNDVRELSRNPPSRLVFPLSFASNRGALPCACWLRAWLCAGCARRLCAVIFSMFTFRYFSGIIRNSSILQSNLTNISYIFMIFLQKLSKSRDLCRN